MMMHGLTLILSLDLCIQTLIDAGTGADEDIVVSSARAYVHALNKMIGWMSASNKVTPVTSKSSSSMSSVDGLAAAR